jgi:carboxyl-terminal processing protease
LAVLLSVSGTAFSFAAPLDLYNQITSIILNEYYDSRARSPEFKKVIRANAAGIKTRAEAISAAQTVIAKLGDPFTSLLDQQQIQKREVKQSGIKNLPPVKVTVKTGGTETTKTIPVRTENIAVQASWLNADTAYLYVGDFDNRLMPKQLQRAVESQNLTSAKNLILDLRGNVGGFVSNAAQLLGFLMGSAKDVATLQTAHGIQPLNLTWPASNPRFTGKLIVLVDKHSASASELVAAAIQKHKRGILIGEKTSGSNIWKGNRTIEPGLILYLAFAKWSVQSGKYTGLVPDKLVPTTAADGPWTTYRSRFDPDRDPQRDKQLRIALDSISP